MHESTSARRGGCRCFPVFASLLQFLASICSAMRCAIFLIHASSAQERECNELTPSTPSFTLAVKYFIISLFQYSTPFPPLRACRIDKMRKTKIVCTIGPASASEKVLRQLIQTGMDVAGLNFSTADDALHRHSISL